MVLCSLSMDPSSAFKRKIEEIVGLESRLILLKQKAAECEKIRAERDCLLRQINEFNNIEVQRLIHENNKLMRENYEIKCSLKSELESKNVESLSSAGDFQRVIEDLQEKNKKLKKEIQDLLIVSEERDNLKEENQTLKDKINSGYLLPGPKDRIITVNELKNELTKCCHRLRHTLEQNEKLTNLLNEKEVNLDLLFGKITQLQSRLYSLQIITDQFSLLDLIDGENRWSDSQKLLLNLRTFEKGVEEGSLSAYKTFEGTKDSINSFNFGYLNSKFGSPSKGNSEWDMHKKGQEGSTEPVSVQTSYSMEAFNDAKEDAYNQSALKRLVTETKQIIDLHNKIDKLRGKKTLRFEEVDLYNSHMIRIRPHFLQERRKTIHQLP